LHESAWREGQTELSSRWTHISLPRPSLRLAISPWFGVRLMQPTAGMTSCHLVVGCARLAQDSPGVGAKPCHAHVRQRQPQVTVHRRMPVRPRPQPARVVCFSLVVDDHVGLTLSFPARLSCQSTGEERGPAHHHLSRSSFCSFLPCTTCGSKSRSEEEQGQTGTPRATGPVKRWPLSFRCPQYTLFLTPAWSRIEALSRAPCHELWGMR
jgi:hypothetical protein